MHLLTPKGQSSFDLRWPQVLWSQRSDDDRWMSICTSIDATRPVEHSETICIALSRFCKMLYAKSSYDLIWHEITLTKDHWAKLRLNHHHWPEICSFWRFRTKDFETVAMPAQNTPWIAIPAWYVLEENVKVTGQRGQGSQIFRKVLNCSKLGYWKYRCYPPPFTWVFFSEELRGSIHRRI